MLTLAISKGRIFKQARGLLEATGITLLDDPEQSRKLILRTSEPDIRVLIVRTSDVPTYVRYGAADIGVAGKDVLREVGMEGLYEVLDLHIARCRMMTAGPQLPRQQLGPRLRVATKYMRIAHDYFSSLGQQIDLIKLYGSMELAPLLQLSDQIVDLVDTGNTLKENGLVPLETICSISSRLVVNRAAQKVKAARISALTEALRSVVKKP